MTKPTTERLLAVQEEYGVSEEEAKELMRAHQRAEWLNSMMKKYRTDEAGVGKIMRKRQQKSMKNPNRQKGVHKGGFSNKELAKQAGKKGLESRWGATSGKSSQD